MLTRKIKLFILFAIFGAAIIGLYTITIDLKIFHHNFSNSFIVIDKATDVSLRGNFSKSENTLKGKILFLHGAGPLGRRWPFYRLLQAKLANEGYEVAAFNFRTFGDSTKPKRTTYEYLNRIQDIGIILNYLKWNSCHIIGHSMGASIGMNAVANGIKNTEIKSIISIGPARRVEEIFLKEGSPNFIAAKQGLENRLGLSIKISDSVLKKILENINIDNSIEYFSSPKHVPIFLIDGEDESKNDQLYLKRYFNLIIQPKEYYTIPNSDHYCNTKGLLSIYNRIALSDYEIVVYNKVIINDLLQKIFAWLNKYG